MSGKKDSTSALKKGKANKTLWWSLLWANVAMLVVLVATFLFQRYLYTQMVAYTLVDVEINPFIVAVGYVVGVLITWAVIYKLLKTEPDDFSQFDDRNQNHNIY